MLVKQGLIIDTQFQETIAERVLVDIRPTQYSAPRSKDIAQAEEWAELHWQTHTNDGEILCLSSSILNSICAVPCGSAYQTTHLLERVK